MKIAVIVVRSLIGLLLLFASVVVLFNLVPQPELTGDVKIFNEGIKASHYLLTTLKVFELVCALCFLTGLFVPLATVVIFPASLNILLYHCFVDTAGLPVAIFLMAGNLFLAWYYRDRYAPILKMK